MTLKKKIITKTKQTNITKRKSYTPRHITSGGLEWVLILVGLVFHGLQSYTLTLMIILFGFQSDFILYPKLSWTVRVSTDGHSVECLCVIFQLARVWYQMRKRYFLLISGYRSPFGRKSRMVSIQNCPFLSFLVNHYVVFWTFVFDWQFYVS